MALKLTGLQKFRSGIDDAIDDGVFATASGAVTAMRPDTPVDEGDLVFSERIDPPAPDGGAVYAVRAGGISGPNKFVNYAAFVEARDGFFSDAVATVDLRANVRQRVTALAKRSRA